MITVREFIQIHTALREIVESKLGIDAPLPEAVKDIMVRFAEASALPAGAAGTWTEEPVSPVALAWLALLDVGVNPHLLRRYMKQFGGKEELIRAFIRFYADRPKHSEVERDKVDWLSTYFFSVREERTHVATGWPKAEIQEMFQGFAFQPLSDQASIHLTDLCGLLEEVRYFEMFVQITDSRVIQRGRQLKNHFGEEFFHPEVLVAIVNYNLVFGKIFHTLLQKTVEDVRDFVSELGNAAQDPHELVQTDYRATTDAFRSLGELERKHESKKGPKATAAFAKSLVGSPENLDPISRAQRLKALGINFMVEGVALKKRRDELTARFKANPTLKLLPGSADPAPLRDWELNAFLTSYPEAEKSFRADFASTVAHGLSILSLMGDELAAYRQKKDSEFLWKRHYDTLLFLLQEGHIHKDHILELAQTAEKKGLTAKAEQLKQASEKLDTGLAEVATIFAR